MFKYFYTSIYSTIFLLCGFGNIFFNPWGAIGSFWFLAVFQCTYLRKDFMKKKQHYDNSGREMPDEEKKYYKNKRYVFYGSAFFIFFFAIFFGILDFLDYF